MNIIRMGEAAHAGGFKVLREHGYPHYLLLITKTPVLFEYEGNGGKRPQVARFSFVPAEAQLYGARGCLFRLLGAHPKQFAALV